MKLFWTAPLVGLAAAKTMESSTKPLLRECGNQLGKDIAQKANCDYYDFGCHIGKMEELAPQLFEKQSPECQQILESADQDHIFGRPKVSAFIRQGYWGEQDNKRWSTYAHSSEDVNQLSTIPKEKAVSEDTSSNRLNNVLNPLKKLLGIA